MDSDGLTYHSGIVAQRPEKIYVEIEIRSSFERLWHLTQTPALHEQWDLRFSQIRYLPRAAASDPQRFNYVTRIGFGLAIRGGGESVGSLEAADGTRSSALRFWSDDSKSLIREGFGYWKYIPDFERGTIRFLTLYDYDTRFGPIGRGFDRWLFRPLIGWATAWSFDRLRLWIESGQAPAASARFSIIYCLARATVAFVWLYEGIVPKLILRHADELTMLHALGLSGPAARSVLLAIGFIELGIGLALLLSWRWGLLLWFTLLGMPLALVCVAAGAPRYLGAPFNPVVLNFSVFVLAAIALLTRRLVPSACRCLRRPPGDGA